MAARNRLAERNNKRAFTRKRANDSMTASLLQSQAPAAFGDIVKQQQAALGGKDQAGASDEFLQEEMKSDVGLAVRRGTDISSRDRRSHNVESTCVENFGG